MYDYETSPNEKTVIYAVALHGPAGWTVQLVEGSESTYDRRSAPLGAIGLSLVAKGYEKESFAGKKALPLDRARLATLTGFVEEAQRALQVPGVGLAVIEKGQVVLERGFGVRELGKPAKVDENTRFAIASNTKGMTTLLLATLVDDKKLAWETPVASLYPAFRLGDAATTEQVRVKHLVCAHGPATARPRMELRVREASTQGILWLAERHAADDEVRRNLSILQPPRERGRLRRRPRARAWQRARRGLRRRDADAHLRAPRMKTATLSIDQALAGNHASPHGNDVDGKAVVLDVGLNRSLVTHRAAGGAWRCAGDGIATSNIIYYYGTNLQQTLYSCMAPQLAIVMVAIGLLSITISAHGFKGKILLQRS